MAPTLAATKTSLDSPASPLQQPSRRQLVSCCPLAEHQSQRAEKLFNMIEAEEEEETAAAWENDSSCRHVVTFMTAPVHQNSTKTKTTTTRSYSCDCCSSSYSNMSLSLSLSTLKQPQLENYRAAAAVVTSSSSLSSCPSLNNNRRRIGLSSKKMSKFLITCMAIYIANLALFFIAFAALVSFSSSNTSSSNEIIHNNYHQMTQPPEEVQQRLTKSYKVGKFAISYQQSGHLFQGGMVVVNLTGFQLTTSLMLALPVEESFRQMFVDEIGENRYTALGPAIVLSPNRQHVEVFQRIWLGQYESLEQRLGSAGAQAALLNTYAENYLTHRTLTENYSTVVKPTRIIAIPATTNCRKPFLSYRTDGPMDARAFTINGTNYLSFHMWHIDSEIKGPRSRIFLLNTQTSQLSKLKIRNYTMLWTEINWVPLILNGTLFYTYSFDPLRVIRCANLTTHPIIWCDMIFQPTNDNKDLEFNEWWDAFRGGTPWLHYQGAYFISFAHTHVQYILGSSSSSNLNKAATVERGIYSANLVVLKIDQQQTNFRLIYVSEPMQFSTKLLQASDITRSHILAWPFVFPIGALLRNGDVADIGVHINDSRGYIFRLHGLLALMRRIISLDDVEASSSSFPFDQSSRKDKLDSHAALFRTQPKFGLIHQLSRASMLRMRDDKTSDYFP